MPANHGIMYVRAAPTFSVEEGHFHICYTIGSERFEFVMSPRVFLTTLRRANKASDEFHEGGAEVVAIKSKSGH